MTPETWTIVGAGIALCGIGIGGFTLLWRYVAAAEQRSERRDAAIEKRAEERDAAIEKRAEERDAAIEKRAEERDAAIEKRAEARNAELKADLKADVADLKADLVDLRADVRMLADRMERNHADLRHAIDALVVSDQAKRLTILEEAVLRTTRSPDDREAQH